MKILTDKYNKMKEKFSKFPKKLTCEQCQSELEYEAEDIRIGALGFACVDCPLCGRDNILDEECGITLTINNTEFPKHFHHICVENEAIDCYEEKFNEYLCESINYFRKNKDEFDYGGHITGNLYLKVHRYDDDKVYEVTVSKDFYTTTIPFEEEDYKEII